MSETVKDIELIIKSIIIEAGKNLVEHIKNLIENFYLTKDHQYLMEFFDQCYEIVDAKLPTFNKLLMFCIRVNFIKTLNLLLPQQVIFLKRFLVKLLNRLHLS